ncbi:DUF982 domain-containing protein [Mesorhizobium sp. CAU 1732]|uniref:DUF982 domain-containing protein n=1 Tax=Mesorhizobium sp. CAU 1732 TaxID=3140358 RepID=UPI00325FE313
MTINTTFHEPVLLRGNGGVTSIRTAVEASEALQLQWPEARGKWYHAANRACASAAEGRTSPHVARRIFLQAAEESRVRA